jgi:hypothetical protein
MAKKYTRQIGVELDQQSLNAFRADMAQGFARAAAESGDKVYDGLKGALDKTIADLKVKLAEGVISPKEFKAQAAIASEALAGEMRKAKEAGKLTDAEFVKLSKTLKTTGATGKQAFKGMETGATSLMGTLKKVGGVLAGLFALNKLRQFGTSSIEAALSAEKSARRIAAVWKATGNAVGKSVDELLRLSDELERSTLFNKTDIEEAMAQLLTYKSIAGDTFNRAINLATDMATVFGGLSGSTQALAKALDDPIKGLGLLAKAGYTFDDAVIAQIQSLMKHNRLLEAQTLILRTLEGEQGGVARQMKTGWVGAVDTFSKSWGRLKERIGEALLSAKDGPPIIERLTGKLEDLEQWVITNRREIAEFTNDVLGLTEALVKLGGALSKPFRLALHPIKSFKNWRERVAFDRLNAGGTFGIEDPAGRTPTPTPIIPGKPKQEPSAPGLTAEELRKLREEREKALDAEIAALKRGHDLRTLTSRDIARAVDLETQMRERLKAGNLALEERNKLTERLAALSGVTPDASGRVRAALAGGRGMRVDAPGRFGDNPLVHLPNTGMAEPLVKAAEEVESAWTKAMHAIEDEVAKQRGLIGELADAWAYGGLGGLVNLAKGKVRENLARAIEEGAKALGSLARGFPGNAAAHGKAAAGHVKAAAAWGVLSKAGGGGGGSAAIGRMGGPGNTGRTAADRAQPAASETHIYIDPLSASDPRVVQLVAGARARGDRYGASVHVHPYPKAMR